MLRIGICDDIYDARLVLRAALERALETAIPPEVYDAMEAELRGADGPA